MTERKFGRRVQFDPRSLNFGVAALVVGRKPRSYTWSCATHLDQGNLGSCVGHGWAHEANARPVVHPVTEDDALAIYHRAQQLDDEPGENYEGTSVLAGAKAQVERGWLKEYRWALNGLDDLALAIGYQGPAVLGVNWRQGMMDTDSNGFIHVTGGSVGGHCILAKGVNISKKYFTLHQSWGTSWGYGGDCYIDFADMEILLADQGEAAIPVRRS